jgi:FAD:protein FMN transferase
VTSRPEASPREIGSASFDALGTTAHVVTLDASSLAPARRAVEEELATIDAACSRFRGDSALARLNASPGRWVDVGDVLCEAIERALQAAAETDGRIDPTIGRSLRRLGYEDDFRSNPPRPDRAFAPVPAGRFSEIELDREHARVRIPAGVALDLGATAKALAADRAADRALEHSAGVLVSLGGDIRVGGESPAHGWVVRISDDHRAAPSEPGQSVSISVGGLATSSTTVRAWTRGGHAAHHIVDPATGAPARVVWRTVSVAASSCLGANVATTASIVQGEGAVAWLAACGLPARLVRASGEVVTCGGWPADEQERAASA